MTDPDEYQDQLAEDRFRRRMQSRLSHTEYGSPDYFEIEDALNEQQDDQK